MGLKIFLTSSRMLVAACLFGFIIALSGCASTFVKSTPGASLETPQEAGGGEENAEKPGPSPRAIAALQLTEQGRMFLEQQQPDDAIGILERALNLNPDNGRNYYYLAEAWLMKGNISQASEFNRLAGFYLKDDTEWLKRVILQRERIMQKEPKPDRDLK
ncbi:MAG: tetratricopeptide repeat protein [Desulfobacterales bacterium]